MTKIEEIIEKNRLHTTHYADREFAEEGTFSITSAMKEYAEYYAKLCLEKAAEGVKTYTTVLPNKDKDGFITGYKNTVKVDKESITNIKLPAHE